MIRLHQVSKTYGDVVALMPTDLTISGGQTTVLIGPSGCGKSTLLRLIIGLLTPTQGTVEVQGETMEQESMRRLRQKMGYVLQDGGLFPHLSARDNILLMARYLNMPDAEMTLRLDELAELTHFPKAGLDRFPGELSGGQRQRVSLMRALMLDPDVLLLDEPLGALDPLVLASLQSDLREIFQRLKKTVVLVTHNLSEAAYLGDEIVLMKAGHIEQQGSLADLMERPASAFVTEFLQAQRTILEF